MSKYGVFGVVRTERRVPKKATDPNVDADGMREYSFLKCPHCKTEDIIIASLNLKIQKHATIREHVAVCPSYTGERPVKRCKEKKESAALVVRAPTASPESESTGISLEEQFLALKNKVADQDREMADLKQENVDMKQKDADKDRRLEKLEDKTCLYDGVLAAVMPSLALPLTAPEENAKITLREAAIKDLTPGAMTLALTGPMDVIPREMHKAMIEQKDALIAVEKERREEMKEAHTAAMDNYKKALEAKDGELMKAVREREAAVKRRSAVEKEMQEKMEKLQEANKTATTASSRAEKLQRERDALKAKFDAELKAKEQLGRMHGKHGLSQLSKVQQQGLKRSLAEHAAMDAQTAAAVAIEREFAAKRARQGS